MAKELSFEEALKELEEIVASLENQDISLDEAVKNYQKGLELSKRCYDIFSEKEKLIVKKVDEEGISDFNNVE